MSDDEGGEIDAEVTVDEAAAGLYTEAATQAQKDVFDELFGGASPRLPPLRCDGRSDIPNNRPTLTLTAVHRQSASIRTNPSRRTPSPP